MQLIRAQTGVKCEHARFQTRAVTSKDRYGRVLGQVYVKRCQPECLSYYVNAEMVKSGLAWAYRFHNKATSPAMAELETEARKKKIGLWADPNAIEPWHYRQREKMLSN
ncbi:TPA: thermonuclease family protein [Kluyvera ascorbata]|nr:thermonuclease family protein [Kluyvera ascorbata]